MTRPCLLLLLTLLASGCSRMSMPNVSLPGIGDDDPPASDQTATPRDLLTAQLVNPRAREDMPNMTVGKLIEYADRYLACDCATTRFVRTWEQTADGYRLVPNSEVVRPLEFVCRTREETRECFLTEIDRGPRSEDFAERFVPGSQFIEFLYDNGVRCARETACP
ncbi:MAG: hypothetical protein RLW62_02940 [Gammaproteobacteria bacterium]